jgi:para-nitrobenzyl esterase
MFLKIIKKFKLIIFIVFSFSINADNSVSTSSGITEAKLKNRVLIWSDIPYAQAPIGDLRWKAPRAIINSNANIQPKENNFCIQKTSTLGGSSQFSEKIISGTEDCLYLDIFAPKNSVDKKLPVMFWIHGGGNTSGLKDLYDFSKMVRKHDVIVVRINYRLGPFGWFTHPAIQGLQEGIDKTSNFGTLDIIAALDWVKKNISLFGGDSNNVTIFGESAGGHNVYSLIASKKAEGLFHKAIAMSGYTTSISLQNAHKQETDSSTSDFTSSKVVNQLIGNYSKKETRERLLNISSEEFFTIYANRKSYQEIPLLTADNIVIPDIGLREALSKKALINNVPLIAGSNADEVKLWLATAEYFVDLDYSILGSLLEIPKVVLKDENAFEAFNYYRSSAWKIRGVDEPLNNLTKAGNEKLYAYRFDWDDHRRLIVGDFKKLIGAAHATEIPLLAGNTKLVGGYPLSDLIYPPSFSKFYLSRNMMKFWANFAKYGYPGKSSNSIKWEPYDIDNGANYMILDKKKNLRMSQQKLSFISLSQELYNDKRVSELEKCVVLLQMFTFVGDDLYDENIENYSGKCDRNTAEQFLKDNASFIEY